MSYSCFIFSLTSKVMLLRAIITLKPHKVRVTFMNSEWGWLACVFLGCDFDTKTCTCLRCGRVKHLYLDEPKFMDTAYELCGQDKYGRMVYAKTANTLYICSRCGAREVHSSSTYENH